MTPAARLAEIEQRVKDATRGPWQWWDQRHCLITETPDHNGAYDYILDQAPGNDPHDRSWLVKNCDMSFIVHAREDIPFLLTLLRQQQAVVERIDREFGGLMVRTYDAEGVMQRQTIRDVLGLAALTEAEGPS